MVTQRLFRTQKSKKKVFKAIDETNSQTRINEPFADNPARKKAKSKRKEAKRSFCE